MSEANTLGGVGAIAPELLRYRDVSDALVEAAVMAAGDDERLPEVNGLVIRRMKLEAPGGPGEALQIRPVPYGPDGLAAGYQLLDNVILAGLRLRRGAEDDAYPPEVARLIGHDADSAAPFALLEPYRGRPIGEHAGNLLLSDRRRFQVSLLTSVRLLGAAGIAHRGLSPSTVRWDGDRVQITGFAHTTVLGAPRTVVGTPPWCAPEQRSGYAEGDVTDRDDIWAAGRLIYYVVTGEQLTGRAELADNTELAGLLAGIFGPPEERPSAAELLARIGATDPVRHGADGSPALDRGREEFHAARYRKHPETSPKDDEDEEEVAPTRPEAHRPVVVLRSFPRYLAPALLVLAGVAVAALILLIAR